jgi:hypothetical protein
MPPPQTRRPLRQWALPLSAALCRRTLLIWFDSLISPLTKEF